MKKATTAPPSPLGDHLMWMRKDQYLEYLLDKCGTSLDNRLYSLFYSDGELRVHLPATLCGYPPPITVQVSPDETIEELFGENVCLYSSGNDDIHDNKENIRRILDRAQQYTYSVILSRQNSIFCIHTDRKAPPSTPRRNSPSDPLVDTRARARKPSLVKQLWKWLTTPCCCP